MAFTFVYTLAVDLRWKRTFKLSIQYINGKDLQPNFCGEVSVK